MVGISIVFSINSIIISFIFACNTVIVPIILLSLMSHLTTVDINVVELYTGSILDNNYFEYMSLTKEKMVLGCIASSKMSYAPKWKTSFNIFISNSFTKVLASCSYII